MKKSVKSLLLALMVLCLSASAGFADGATTADVSADIAVVSTDIAEISGDAAIIFKAVKKVDNVSASVDGNIEGISVDVVSKSVMDTAVVSASVTVKIEAGKSDKLKFTPGIAGAKIPSPAKKFFIFKMDTNGVKAEKSSFVDSGETASVDISFDVKSSNYALVFVSGDNLGSDDAYIVKLTVNVAEKTADAATGDKKAFSSATFKLETDVTNGITPTTFEAKVGTTSKEFTLSSDVKLISVDVTSSSDVLSFSNSGIITAVTSASASSDKFTLTVSTASLTSGSVTFKMASGDKESVDITLNFATSSSSSSEKTLEEATSLTGDDLEILSEDLAELLGTTIVEYATDMDDILGTSDAKITAITSTDSGVLVLTVTAGNNTYTAIPAFNGTIPVLVSTSGKMSLPTTLTPTKLAAQLKLLAGSDEVTSIATFYSKVFTDNFFDATAQGTTDSVTGENGGIKSFKGSLKKALPYGTIILVYLLPTADDATDDDAIQGAMVHSGTAGSESASMDIALEDVKDLSGSTVSTAISIPVTANYNVGYSTPDAGGALSGGSVEEESFETADSTTTGETGSFGEMTLEGDEKEDVEGSNKGSSSGCDAGFGALALLAIVPFIRKIRK